MISFDFLFDTIKQPIYLLQNINNQGYQFINSNGSGLELLKLNLDELLTIKPIDLGFIKSSDEWHNIPARIKHQEYFSYIAKIKTNNQQILTSEITLYRYNDMDKEYIVLYQKNMGSQHKMVEALRQSEYRFLQMAEGIVEGLVIYENNKTVFVNSSMHHITGFTKEEIKDMDELDLARKDEKERIIAFREKIKDATKGVQVIELWIVTKSGTQKYVRQSYTFSQLKNDKRSTYVVISDISDKKRIEEALRKSQTEFQMLAENSPDLITRYNKKLNYTYVNKSAQKFTGITAYQFIGKNNKDLKLESSLTNFLEEMHLEVFRTGRILKFEFRLSTPNKSVKIFQANMVPELSNQGIVESVLNVARDITQIKQVEKALTDEKQFMISENKLLATNLTQWCETLYKEHENLINDKHLAPILSIAEWAQYGYNQQNSKPKIISINDFLADFLNEQQKKSPQSNLEFELKLPEHKLSIFSDRALLTKIYQLLFDNALEATKQGKIELGFDIYNEKEIVCFVKDTGIGIKPEDTENIFEPFSCIGKDGHAGLGLSIADKYVETIGGQLWCLSSPGTGSTFCFTHPAEIEKAMLQQKIDSDKSPWTDKKILIVEDTDNNYILLETILMQYGPTIERAIYGKDAIKKAESGNFDIVLMDIELPDINGYEVTKEIRKFNADIPIIAQTAYAMYDNVVKALDSGCNDFIAKPIKAKKLISMMEKLM